MSDDPLDETIRGWKNKIDEAKAKTANLHEFMVEEEKRQGELILIAADVLIPPWQLDALKRVGYGTCRIQEPDGKMRLVSVSIVAPAQPQASERPDRDAMYERAKDMSDSMFGPDLLPVTPLQEARQKVWAADMSKRARDWVIKQPWPDGVDPLKRAQDLLDVAQRMENGEPPFVDSEGRSVPFAYLNDKGWPCTADGQLIDVPIVPTQALRDDREAKAWMMTRQVLKDAAERDASVVAFEEAYRRTLYGQAEELREIVRAIGQALWNDLKDMRRIIAKVFGVK